MSHAVLQTALIMPMNAQIPATGSPSKVFLVLAASSAQFRKARSVVIQAASSLSLSPASLDGGGGDLVAHLEQCLVAASAPSVKRPEKSGPVMRGEKFGSIGNVTLEKSKLDLSQKQTKSSPEVRLAF